MIPLPHRVSVIAFSMFATVSTLPAQTVTVTDASPIEAKLALIDTGNRTVPKQLVDAYARLLDTLNARCRESRTMISDMAVRSTQLIEKDTGKKVKVRTVLEETVKATQSLRDQQCSSTMATVAVLIGQGPRG